MRADFADPGDALLDLFAAGLRHGAPCGEASGRKVIGIERRELDCENMPRRLAQGALPMTFEEQTLFEAAVAKACRRRLFSEEEPAVAGRHAG